MQKSAAWLVLGRQCPESARTALSELHWLNVEAGSDVFLKVFEHNTAKNSSKRKKETDKTSELEADLLSNTAA